MNEKDKDNLRLLELCKIHVKHLKKLCIIREKIEEEAKANYYGSYVANYKAHLKKNQLIVDALKQLKTRKSLCVDEIDEIRRKINCCIQDADKHYDATNASIKKVGDMSDKEDKILKILKDLKDEQDELFYSSTLGADPFDFNI